MPDLKGCNIFQIRHILNNRIDGEGTQPCDQHAQGTGEHAQDTGFRIKYPGDILFPGTQRTEYADLLGAFQNGGVGNDANHNQADHQ